MLTISFNGTDKSLPTTIAAKADAAASALTDKLNELDLQVQQYIVGEELHGQVLQHRSGKLAGSIRAIPATQSGTEITGAVEGGGGPAFYARVHEYGGEEEFIISPVNAKALMFQMNGETIVIAGSEKSLPSVFAKRVVHPPLPARPFMRPALDFMKPQIVEGLQEALSEAME